MKHILALVVMSFSLTALAQSSPVPLIFEINTNPYSSDSDLNADPMLIGIKHSIEDTYNVKCEKAEVTWVSRGLINKDFFRVKCPLDKKSGIKIKGQIKRNSNVTYISSMKIKPYGKILKTIK